MSPDPAHSPGADLPDLNVWLALICTGHPHHQAALGYWEELAAGEVHFCTVTAIGLVRLLCQPKVMGELVYTPAQASAAQKALVAQPGVSFCEAEGPAWDVFHALVREPGLSHRQCTDAHLASLAISGGLRLVTFDRGFSCFPELTWLRLG
ncbi:MAG: PIN domain-containing protein [Cyanobium sp. PLM2.Bin73]|jgi:toxin-antitoxin system PIN domain toxin|nr:MAG: PIN domain-containing protein [Cyanobium sp. PLM2.Bin73]